MISDCTLRVPGIIVGVDTHTDEHIAVVVDKLGARITKPLQAASNPA